MLILDLYLYFVFLQVNVWPIIDSSFASFNHFYNEHLLVELLSFKFQFFYHILHTFLPYAFPLTILPFFLRHIHLWPLLIQCITSFFLSANYKLRISLLITVGIGSIDSRRMIKFVLLLRYEFIINILYIFNFLDASRILIHLHLTSLLPMFLSFLHHLFN